VLPIRALLLHHGYRFLFFYILAAACGAPIPADPLLVIMGAMVGDGRYSLVVAILTAMTAGMIGDFFWYELGRRKGRSILRILCRLSLEPDTCVRSTESRFTKRGAWALLFAKFVPGMSLVSMPLSGATRMPRWQFLLADAMGCLLWSSTYLSLGSLFHKQLTDLLIALGLLGRRAGFVAGLLISAYILWKYIQKVRFRRELRINRITPEEAQRLVQAGKAVTFVDLRNAREISLDGLKIAGAVIVHPEDLRARTHNIPEGNEAILYCTCPNESTSARVALQLKRAGIQRVRPLAGGFEAWHKLGLPVETVDLQTSQTAPITK
jgi:membrane protein DedA with SNARE-associated domain/rhodanese-related sulfurtransferase